LERGPGQGGGKTNIRARSVGQKAWWQMAPGRNGGVVSNGRFFGGTGRVSPTANPTIPKGCSGGATGGRRRRFGGTGRAREQRSLGGGGDATPPRDRSSAARGEAGGETFAPPGSFYAVVLFYVVGAMRGTRPARGRRNPGEARNRDQFLFFNILVFSICIFHS